MAVVFMFHVQWLVFQTRIGVQIGKGALEIPVLPARNYQKQLQSRKGLREHRRRSLRGYLHFYHQNEKSNAPISS